jgi:hypothetical protein
MLEFRKERHIKGWSLWIAEDGRYISVDEVLEYGNLLWELIRYFSEMST